MSNSSKHKKNSLKDPQVSPEPNKTPVDGKHFSTVQKMLNSPGAQVNPVPMLDKNGLGALSLLTADQVTQILLESASQSAPTITTPEALKLRRELDAERVRMAEENLIIDIPGDWPDGEYPGEIDGPPEE